MLEHKSEVKCFYEVVKMFQTSFIHKFVFKAGRLFLCVTKYTTSKLLYSVHCFLPRMHEGNVFMLSVSIWL